MVSARPLLTIKKKKLDHYLPAAERRWGAAILLAPTVASSISLSQIPKKLNKPYLPIVAVFSESSAQGEIKGWILLTLRRLFPYGKI